MPNSPNALAPSAIIFIDNNFGDSTLQIIERQLFLTPDQVISGAEFDARVAANPTYPNVIHGSNSRLLVLRNLMDTTNRGLADIVLRYSNGLIVVEASKFGPPNVSFYLDRVTLIDLLLLQTPLRIKCSNDDDRDEDHCCHREHNRRFPF